MISSPSRTQIRDTAQTNSRKYHRSCLQNNTLKFSLFRRICWIRYLQLTNPPEAGTGSLVLRYLNLRTSSSNSADSIFLSELGLWHRVFLFLQSLLFENGGNLSLHPRSEVTDSTAGISSSTGSRAYLSLAGEFVELLNSVSSSIRAVRSLILARLEIW